MSIYASVFQEMRNVIYIPVRTFCEAPQGIKYFGFTYYPRNKNFKDPPYEPSKLFLVTRIKSMSGRNPTERRCLAELNIDGQKKYNAHRTVVKNIPHINSILWKVKHLVDIRPITWKGELPKDFSGTYLRDTGELVISSKLKVTPEQIKASEEFYKPENKPDRNYLKDFLRKKWWGGFTGTA